MERIHQAFAAARDENRGALVVYVCAGDPSLEVTREVVLAAAAAGADIIELGIPYTDPIADGPVIQAAASRALEAGARLAGVLQCAAQIREQSPVPLVVMSSVSPLFRFGLQRFATEAKAAGIDGVLLSDLPLEESVNWCEIAQTHDLGTVFLVSPSTPPKRAARITAATTGFVYLVSRAGVTGARAELPPELPQLVESIRATTDLPIAVGFGVSTPAHVQQVSRIADGAIVGSAVVKLIEEAGAADAPREAGRFVSELVAGTRR